MKATIEIDLNRISDNEYIIDPTSIYINGYIDWFQLNDFLFGDELINELSKKSTESSSTAFKIEIWTDSDDYRSWIDYKILETYS